jgi:hypothetical protein
VILVDSNLLLYAKIADLPQHARAAAWFEQLFRSGARVGLPWPSLLAFLRISTHPRVFVEPLAVGQAWQQVEEWLALPGVWVPSPGERHAEILGGLLSAGGAGANLVADAHLAALALEHGLEVFSADSDFARFPGVRWRNPIANLR